MKFMACLFLTLVLSTFSLFCEAFAFGPSKSQRKQQHCYPTSNTKLTGGKNENNNHSTSSSKNRRQRLEQKKLRIPKPPRIIRSLKTTASIETGDCATTETITVRNRHQQQKGLGRRIRSSLKERNQKRRHRRREQLNKNRITSFPKPINNNMEDNNNGYSESLIIRRHGMSPVNANNSGNLWKPIRIVRFATRRRPLQRPSSKDISKYDTDKDTRRLVSSSSSNKKTSTSEAENNIDQIIDEDILCFSQNENDTLTDSILCETQKAPMSNEQSNYPKKNVVRPKKLPNDNNNNDNNNDEKEGKRLKVSTNYKTSRSIYLSPSSSEKQYAGLLNEYMTQPITSFSWQSFQETPTAGRRRRWMIRPLEQSEVQRKTFEEERFFRLAVPLMPLLGIDLTPIIDLEVIPALAMKNNKNIQTAKNKFFSIDSNMNLVKPLSSSSSSFVTIRSVRLSILATEDEVKRNMEIKIGDNSDNQFNHELPSPTKVSKDRSIQKMGNEAIDFAEKIENWINPHLSFEGIIQWEEDSRFSESTNSLSSGKRVISINSKATFSATIPPIPFALPIPTFFLAKQIGANLLKRALSLALNQFLRQLERDFKRWAEVDENTSDDATTPTSDE